MNWKSPIAPEGFHAHHRNRDSQRALRTSMSTGTRQCNAARRMHGTGRDWAHCLRATRSEHSTDRQIACAWAGGASSDTAGIATASRTFVMGNRLHYARNINRASVNNAQTHPNSSFVIVSSFGYVVNASSTIIATAHIVASRTMNQSVQFIDTQRDERDASG